MEFDISELREPFFEDALDHLDSIETTLSKLEQDPQDENAVAEMFRSVHSLKGDSGALGFDSLQKMLHQFETILDGIRTGERSLTRTTTDLFGEALSLAERLVEVARNDSPDPEDYESIVASLIKYEQGEASEGTAEDKPESSPASSEVEPVVELEPADDFGLFDDEEDGTSAIAQSMQDACPNQDSPMFVEYLVEHDIITSQQAMEVLEHQCSKQPLLGSVLLNNGYLTAKQVSKTLAAMSESHGRFGDTAVELGYIDGQDLIDALSKQRKERPCFTVALFELEILEYDALESHIEAFKEEHSDATEPLDLPDIDNVEVEEASSEAFDADAELMVEFVVESKEHLENAEEQMLVIEGDSGNSEALNAIYRGFHTIKGVASFLGLDATRNLAHQAESMLNLARDGKLILTGDAFEVALASVDGLKRQVGFAEAWLAENGPLGADPELPKLLAAIDAVANGKKVGELPCRIESEDKLEPKKAEKVRKEKPGQRAPTQLRESIKVDRDRLDKLINVIGELVIGQSMVEEEVAAWQQSIGHESLAMAQLTKTVRDLQELSLSLRMVPVGTVFHKMARIVRDLGRKLGKDIRFETEGDETELDKTVVDQIGDPLMHMVRNAADHGIESAEDRMAAGKPPQGRILLRAFHQGGNIYIEIEDDGKGLDRNALLKKAIEKGIVSETDKLSESDIDNLIFAPGFSTAKQVTDVSGRGVGMDVVRRNVEALQGSVSIQSEFGKGSTVIIRLPLTLAILDGLSIRIGNEVYIVPILSVVESFSAQPTDIRSIAGKGEVVLVRGEVVPLLRLARLLRLDGEEPTSDSSESLVVIVEDRGKKFALLVDELVGQSQVVIKNLEANFRKVDGIAGATILGDGRIAMILDVFGLVSLASHGAASIAPSIASEECEIMDQELCTT